MDYMGYNDNELIGMIRESSEEAKDILFEKYRYIIDIEVKKYLNMANMLGYDYNDLYQDGLVGFADALNSYRDDKDTALASFITLCVDRRLHVAIIKAGRIKNKVITDSLSLEHTYSQLQVPLMDLLSDNSKNDPLENIIKEEKLSELIEQIKEELSDSEYEVYSLMISGLKYSEIAILLDRNLKQVDNTVQRVRNKIKKILDEQKGSN
ncbi:MAG: sigma-70 family RNA polymerase sigma factor [Bacilli bacterium]|nr:sigma-70 family RNA polymerase sigma factor [Bacilli bacterium]